MKLRASPTVHIHFHRSAIAGGTIGLLGLAIVQPGWAPAFLLLSALVLVPLALALASSTIPTSGLLRASAWLQLPTALILLVAFTLPAGPLAGILGLPWFAFTIFVAILGLVRFAHRRSWSIGELGIDSGLIFLAVGGMWTTVSRWGIRPMGFDEPIVLLTGVHFHYAGLVLPLLTGLAAREPKQALSRFIVLGVVVGVPLVALGINLSPLGFRSLEWLSASFLAFAGILAGLLQLQMARRVNGRQTRVLLAVCGVSLIVGMTLAALYAFGTYWDRPCLDIPLMIYSHGAINALGFALPGLVAWNRILPSNDSAKGVFV